MEFQVVLRIKTCLEIQSIHLPFLEDEVDHYLSNHKEMVASQQDELQRIFNGINDIIQLNVFSKSSFDDHIEYANKERKDTIDAVNQLDQDLKSEYILSEGDEQYAIALFQQLSEASRQGNTISPIHFNAEAYKASEVYKLKNRLSNKQLSILPSRKTKKRLENHKQKLKQRSKQGKGKKRNLLS
jgi:predicted ribonuclease toxin of YeeF-YezG toxin-antitoxin module